MILVAIVVAVVVLAGGFVFAVRIDDTASVGVGDSDGSAPPIFDVALQPGSCPSQVRLSTILRRNDTSGLAHRLVPGHPSAVVECGPGAQKVLFGGAPELGQLVHSLNSLEPVPGNEFVWVCPIDLGPKTQPTYGLFFSYPDGDVVLVTVATGGCRFASNGHRIAYTNDAVQKQVKSLFRSA